MLHTPFPKLCYVPIAQWWEIMKWKQRQMFFYHLLNFIWWEMFFSLNFLLFSLFVLLNLFHIYNYKHYLKQQKKHNTITLLLSQYGTLTMSQCHIFGWTFNIQLTWHRYTISIISNLLFVLFITSYCKYKGIMKYHSKQYIFYMHTKCLPRTHAQVLL